MSFWYLALTTQDSKTTFGFSLDTARRMVFVLTELSGKAVGHELLANLCGLLET